LKIAAVKAVKAKRRRAHSGGSLLAILAVVVSLVWACRRPSKQEPPPPESKEDAAAAVSAGVEDLDASAVIETVPNLKVAFIGDTGIGSDFRSVLRLIQRERADLVLVQGDLNYTLFRSAGNWFSVIDRELPKVPYFVAKGNHDTDWKDGFAPGLRKRMSAWGVKPESGEPASINYSVVYKGLKIVMVGDEETSPTTRADYVKARLERDRHLWKVCAWHKNQRASNVGPKNDEMGWAIYEHCRAAGAIVAQAHSHTYSRSKTFTSTTNQIVDPSCSTPFDLCVGPGRHFFFDSSLGGYDARALNTEYSTKPYWAATHGGSFGALFIEFNIDGDPKKARGYFKTTTNAIVDPPPTSGKKTFSITHD